MSHAAEMAPFERHLISGGNGNFHSFLVPILRLLFFSLQPPFFFLLLKTDFLFRSLLCQLIEHEHGFEIVNFSLLLQVIRGNSLVTVEVLQIQVFKCKLTIVK